MNGDPRDLEVGVPAYKRSGATTVRSLPSLVTLLKTSIIGFSSSMTIVSEISEGLVYPRCAVSDPPYTYSRQPPQATQEVCGRSQPPQISAGLPADYM